MNRLKTFVLLLLFLTMSASAWAQGVEKAGAQDLRRLIDSSKGKILIINFWATWCAPCVKEFPGLVSVRKAFPEEVLSVVGISVDYNVRPVENFVKQQEVNFPVYIDDGSISPMLSIDSIPRTLIYNQAGEKVLDHLGFISAQSFQHVVEHLQKAE